MIKEQIDRLIELQEVDLKIIYLENEKKDIPQRVEELHQREKLISGEIKKIEEELKQAQLGNRNKELELQTKEAEIKKYKAQLYQIKTNKEYTSLQGEIEGLKADCSVIEDEIIGLLDKIDNINAKIKKGRERQKVDEENLKKEKLFLDNRIEEIGKEMEQLEKTREAMLVNVDKEIYKKYEKILRGKSSAAVVPVIDNSCGGCHIELPPQVMNELNISQKLIFCENCARILYLTESDKNE